MKDPTPAPIFACFYAGMCNVARARGYALAVHGSLVTDMDLIACPWTPQACSAEELINSLFTYLNATDIAHQLRSVGVSEDSIQRHLDDIGRCPEKKPHGRLAWNLYLHAGIKIDVSVMPRIESEVPSE